MLKGGNEKMYLEIKDVKKSYGEGGGYVQVLKGVNTGVEKGQMCVIQGTSGSGKSTLLNCIGGLDYMDSGSIKVDGTEIFGMKNGALSDYRRDNLGFIFQFYNLVPNLTVKENIQVCEYLTKDPLNMDELNAKYGTTMLIVTHNNSIKNMVHKVIFLKDGVVRNEYMNETRIPACELEDL